MVDKSGKIFTHVNKALIGSDFSEIASPTHSLNKQVFNNLSNELLVHGFSKLNIDGKTYFAGYSKLDNWDISLFAVANAGNVDQKITATGLSTVVLAGIIALACVVASVFLATSFAKLINKMAKATEKVASGDLSGNVEKEIELDRNDEIGVLGRTFRTMVSNLRNFISSSQGSAEQLASSAEELAATSEEVNALSEEIAATIQQISRGASSQSELSAKAIDEI